jgi:ATP-grasp domain
METPILRILLTGTNRWALAARLAISLNDLGCEIFAICPRGSSAIGKTSVVRQFFRYSGLRPLHAIEAAIDAVHPDLIVPTCDRGVEHLHELHARMLSKGIRGEAIAKLIETSIGPASSYALISSRFDLLAVAQDAGVRVPRFRRLRNTEDLADWQATETFPWMIKADGTWGGQGVRVIRSSKSAAAALAQLPQMFRFSRAIKRLVVNRDSFWFRPWWKGMTRAVSAQSFVDGHPANCTAFSWRGKVLAFIAVEVIQSEGLTGPASIVRIIENSDMRFAADQIADRLKLSGFFGLDFMIEKGTNAVYLVELNPRPTPPCHLRFGKGRDLPAALCAQLSGQPLRDRPAVTENTLIAYPPQALKASPDCYRDFPENQPALLEEILNPYPDRTLLYRLVQFFSRKPAEDLSNIRTSASQNKLMKAQPTRSAER